MKRFRQIQWGFVGRQTLALWGKVLNINWPYIFLELTWAVVLVLLGFSFLTGAYVLGTQNAPAEIAVPIFGGLILGFYAAYTVARAIDGLVRSNK